MLLSLFIFFTQVSSAIEIPIISPDAILFECTIISDPKFDQDDYGLTKYRAVRLDKKQNQYILKMNQTMRILGQDQIVDEHVSPNRESFKLKFDERSLELFLEGKPLSRAGNLQIHSAQGNYSAKVTCH